MMVLEEQIKVISYSFVYGILFWGLYKSLNFKRIKSKNIRFIISFLFCVLNSILFYFILYKINNGILNYYIAIFFIIGVFFCKVLYFGDKNR